jgi:hypothetical protein
MMRRMEARISSIEGSWILEFAELMRVTDQPVRESTLGERRQYFTQGKRSKRDRTAKLIAVQGFSL